MQQCRRSLQVDGPGVCFGVVSILHRYGGGPPEAMHFPRRPRVRKSAHVPGSAGHPRPDVGLRWILIKHRDITRKRCKARCKLRSLLVPNSIPESISTPLFSKGPPWTIDTVTPIRTPIFRFKPVNSLSLYKLFVDCVVDHFSVLIRENSYKDTLQLSYIWHPA